MEISSDVVAMRLLGSVQAFISMVLLLRQTNTKSVLYKMSAKCMMEITFVSAIMARAIETAQNHVSCSTLLLIIQTFLRSLMSLDIYNASCTGRLTFWWLWQVARCLSVLFYFTPRLLSACSQMSRILSGNRDLESLDREASAGEETGEVEDAGVL